MKKRAMILQRILELTERQNELLRAENKEELLEALEERQQLIDQLAALPSSSTPEERTLELRILDQGRNNEQIAMAEIAFLRESMRKTREGMATASLYEGLGSDIGATYFDRGQ